MQNWIDIAAIPTSRSIQTGPTAPPVDELLRVYLGQSCGSRAPEIDFEPPAAHVQDLWDYLGDFA